jgi:hypothetical protein
MGGALFRGIFLRSGAPSGAEIRRMEAREEVMLRELPERKIMVLPVGVLNVGASYREGAARDLAAMLRDAGFKGAFAGSRVYDIPYPRQPNQAWLYWKRFRGLADAVKSSPPGEADYVLLMDVMARARDDGTLWRIGGIHVMAVTGRGEMTFGRLQNSLHRVFKEIQPRTLADACHVALETLLTARADLSDSGKYPGP